MRSLLQQGATSGAVVDFQNMAFLKMGQDASYAQRASPLLMPDETVVDSYKAMRDGVVFTNKRIIAINVQGLTGKKIDYTSIPYTKIQAYSVETSGTFDLDTELEIWVSSIGKVKFEFKGKSNVVAISKHISAGAL